MITGLRPERAPGRAIKMQSDSVRMASLIVLRIKNEMNVISATTSATWKQTEIPNGRNVFLVGSMDKIPAVKHLWHKWTMLNCYISRMATLKTNKNACNVNTCQDISLSITCSIIAKIGSHEPLIRCRSNSRLKIFSANIADHCTSFI